MEAMRTNTGFSVKEIAARFEALEEAVPMRSIQTREEYDRAVHSLNGLLDDGGADEGHSLAALVDTLGTLIEAYEREYIPEPPVTGSDALRFLMEQHGLRQSDLPEIGSQGVVSEILAGKRDLTSRHIVALRDRFGVSADAFL